MSGESSGDSGEQSATTDESATGETATGAASSVEPRLDGPRRLHVLTVPYRLGQQGISIAIALFVFGVPGLSALFGSDRSLLAVGAAVAILGGLGAIVGYFVAYYRRFTYELTTDTFDIRSGVLSKREREIPLRRIQNVDISQNVVQRLLGIAEVGLETAGGGGTEAQLRYVGDAEADRLQAEISRLSRAVDAEEGAVTPDRDRFETIFSMTQRELGTLALVSVDFRIAAFLFFGASVFAPSAASMFDPGVVLGPESVVDRVLGPLAGLLVVVALALVSGLLNAARYYGFTLDRGDEELRYERGLLQKYRGTIPLSKVQSLTIRENVIARTLGYASLTIETAGYAPTSGESNGSQSAIPLADRDRVVSLARSLEAYDQDGFERPPRRARLRYAARYAIALAVLTVVLFLGTRYTGYGLYWSVPLVLAPLIPVAAHLKWRSRGYALGEDHVLTRNGFWVRKQKIVPYHRVQTTFSSETIFQRRRDLATATVDTAGSQSFTGDDARAVDVDVETANRIREEVADDLYVALARRRDERQRSGLADGSVDD